MDKERRIAAIERKITFHCNGPNERFFFRDFLPVLQYPELFDDLITLFVEHLQEQNITAECVVGIESSGFLLGPSLSQRLNVPFVPVRKSGKLGGTTVKESCYAHEEDALEIQPDKITKGMKVVIIDDLVATGGTMKAAVKLVKRVGGVVEQCLSVLILTEFCGWKVIPAPFYSVVEY